MSPSLSQLITALGAKRSGKGWMAKCPAHDDRTPSLSIYEKDGKIRVTCFAGCNYRDVARAIANLGIQLWPDPSPKKAKPGKRIVCTYDYTDERGRLLYQVVRFEPKEFMPRYPDGRGDWVWKKHPHQVLYRLREVLEAPIVFVVEGERDVETLRAYGFVATTKAGGARSEWLQCYTEALLGRVVIIIPDNDKPGWDCAKRIARALIGYAAQILILDDIHRDGCKDISDWFEKGHSECELIAMLEGVHAV